MAATNTFAPPWMPSPATFMEPPALPAGYYQGSAAGDTPAVPRDHGDGSIGTFFGVLAAVLLLTAVSCVFGRVCRRQAEGPDEMYDCTRLSSHRWRWWRAPPRIVRRGAKPPPAAVEEVPAALPLPEP